MVFYNCQGQIITIEAVSDYDERITIQGNGNKISISSTSNIAEIRGNGNQIYIVHSYLRIDLQGNGNNFKVLQSKIELKINGNANSFKTEEDLEPLQVYQCNGFGNQLPYKAVTRSTNTNNFWQVNNATVPIPWMNQLNRNQNQQISSNHISENDFRQGNKSFSRNQIFNHLPNNLFTKNPFQPKNASFNSFQPFQQNNIQKTNLLSQKIPDHYVNDHSRHFNSMIDENEEKLLKKKTASRRKQQIRSHQIQQLQKFNPKVQSQGINQGNYGHSSNRKPEINSLYLEEQSRNLQGLGRQYIQLGRNNQQKFRMSEQQRIRNEKFSAKLNCQKLRNGLQKQRDSWNPYFENEGFETRSNPNGYKQLNSNNPYRVPGVNLAGTVQNVNVYQNYFVSANQCNRPQISNLSKEISEAGLSINELQRLNTHSHTGPQITQCSICCVQIQINDEVTFLNCFHYYHAYCIKSWLKKSAKCPICNENVRKNL